MPASNGGLRGSSVVQSAVVLQQVTAEKAKLAQQEAVAKKVGQIQGARTVEAVTILAWAGGISFALIAGSAVLRAVRKRA